MASGYRKGTNYTKLVRINSRNKLWGTNANFRVDLGNALQQVTQVSIVSAQFYNVFYNVYSQFGHANNLLTYLAEPADTFITIQLEPGFYSAQTLADAISTAIATNGTAPMPNTFTLDPISGKYSLVFTTSGESATFTPSTSTGLVIDLDPLNMLGWNYNGANITIGNTAVVANSVPTMVDTSKVYVLSAALSPSNSVDETGISSNILLPIINSVPWGYLNTFECKVDTFCEISYSRPRNLNQIDIQLVDHDLRQLDLQNTELQLELRIWCNNVY
jgi:hypothetical protein